jgi:hypothetical protein
MMWFFWKLKYWRKWVGNGGRAGANQSPSQGFQANFHSIMNYRSFGRTGMSFSLASCFSVSHCPDQKRDDQSSTNIPLLRLIGLFPEQNP